MRADFRNAQRKIPPMRQPFRCFRNGVNRRENAPCDNETDDAGTGEEQRQSKQKNQSQQRKHPLVALTGNRRHRADILTADSECTGGHCQIGRIADLHTNGRFRLDFRQLGQSAARGRKHTAVLLPDRIARVGRKRHFIFVIRGAVSIFHLNYHLRKRQLDALAAIGKNNVRCQQIDDGKRCRKEQRSRRRVQNRHTGTDFQAFHDFSPAALMR